MQNAKLVMDDVSAPANATPVGLDLGDAAARAAALLAVQAGSSISSEASKRRGKGERNSRGSIDLFEVEGWSVRLPTTEEGHRRGDVSPLLACSMENGVRFGARDIVRRIY